MKKIKGIEDYYAKEDGTIWSTKVSPRYNPNGELRLVKPRTHPSGYLYVGLYDGEGKSKRRLWRRVHRVVYETFSGKIKKGLEIDHISGDKHDNSIDNLRMVNRSQNMIAAFERRRNKLCA